MSFDLEMPESIDTGNAFLTEPGTYHLAVISVDDSPVSKGGMPIEAFKIEAEVLDGTTPGQNKKQVEIMFFNPKLTDKNNGEMAKKKQARFALAVGLIGGPKPAGERVSINLDDAIGRQFIATFAADTQADGKTFLRLHFADIWHVDDPAAQAFPKNAKALALLPAGLRRTSDSFGGAPSGNGRGNGHAQPPRRETVAPAASPPLANLDDL